MLGRLQRNCHTCQLAQLPRPHAGGIDHHLAVNVAQGGLYAGNSAIRLQNSGTGYLFEQRRTLLPRALGQRHRHIDRVDAAVVLDVETSENVVGFGDWEQTFDLFGRQLLHVDTALAVEGRDAPVLF